MVQSVVALLLIALSAPLAGCAPPSDLDQSPARGIAEDISAARDVGSGTLSPGQNPRDEPPEAYPWEPD